MMVLFAGVLLGSAGHALTPPDGLPEREAIAVDLVSAPFEDPPGVHAVVLNVEEWDDAFAGAASRFRFFLAPLASSRCE